MLNQGGEHMDASTTEHCAENFGYFLDGIYTFSTCNVSKMNSYVVVVQKKASRMTDDSPQGRSVAENNKIKRGGGGEERQAD